MLMATDSRQQNSQDNLLAVAEGCGFGYGFATFQNPSWGLEGLLEGSKGTLVSGVAHGGFRSVVTDSRSLRPGDVFVALQGANFDGRTFISQAIKKGAGAVITTKAPDIILPVPCILVDDTEQALGDLAAYRRAMMKNIKVLAVTGSSGKTTVKEMTASILERKGRVLKTKGNFNNCIGLPLSLLPVNYRHDFAVLEMGMNRPGEIKVLTQIAQPDVACVLNVQAAHLEGLGSIEAVARAKGELFAGCRKSATLVVNSDDKRVVALAQTSSASKITFGRQKGAFVRATRITARGEKGMAFTLHVGDEKSRVFLAACGAHNVCNSLAAAAMSHAVGVTVEDIVLGLEAFQPGGNRYFVTEMANGLKVINDTYNANPSSMRAAIDTVCGMRREAKSAAIFGDMLELGDFSIKAHQELGETVARSAFDYLLTVGDFAQEIVKAARIAGMGSEMAIAFPSKDALGDCLQELLRQKHLSSGDYLLFKGSRGMRMEEVIENIRTFVSSAN